MTGVSDFSRLSGVPQAYIAKMVEDVPQGDRGALELFLALRSAARRVEHAVATWLDRSELTSTKLDVLHLLRSGDGMSVTQMSEFLRMTQPNVTFVVNALERDGSVVRATSPTDRRSTIVRLSEAGERLIAGVTPLHMRAITRALENVSARDRKRFVATLAAVAEGFERIELDTLDTADG